MLGIFIYHYRVTGRKILRLPLWGEVALQLNHAAAHRDRDRLRAVAGTQLIHQVPHVNLDGFLGNKQPLGDVPVAIAAGDKPQYIELPRRESFVAEMLGKLSGHFGRNTLLARVHLADDFEKFPGGHALEQVAAGARFQCALDFDIALEGRQYDDAGVGELRSDGYHNIDAAQIGESEVHQGDIRYRFPKLQNRLIAAGGGRHQEHVRLAVDNGGDPLPEEWMIVHTQDPDGPWFTHFQFLFRHLEPPFCFFSHKVSRAISSGRSQPGAGMLYAPALTVRPRFPPWRCSRHRSARQSFPHALACRVDPNVPPD